MGYIQVFSIQIPVEYVIVLFSLAATFIVLFFILKDDITFRKSYFDVLSSVLIYGFFIYKLSYILRNPSVLWQNPLELIYFNGGKIGIIVSFAWAFFYLWASIKKHQWNLNKFLQIIFITAAVFLIFYYGNLIIFALFG